MARREAQTHDSYVSQMIPLTAHWGLVGGSPNTCQWAYLSRRISPLADVIASLIPVIMAGGMHFPGMPVGIEMRGK